MTVTQGVLSIGRPLGLMVLSQKVRLMFAAIGIAGID